MSLGDFPTLVTPFNGEMNVQIGTSLKPSRKVINKWCARYRYMSIEDALPEKCERRTDATCTQDGSFEAWLHGCHYLAVKSGIMYFYKGRYKTYPGRGDKNERRTVIISPCFQESDLRMWLSAEELLDEKVNKAIALAREAHWEQRRDDGSPYLEQHVYPVAAMILREG